MAGTNQPNHTYRGHRRQSFVASDINELTELRARQRTFYGAYGRTAIGSLGYSLTILRLFEPSFRRIGLVFAVLGGIMLVLAFLRSRHSTHDFADRPKEAQEIDQGLKTVGQEGGRIFGRPFVTAGWIAVQLTFVVAVVEITLLVLILRQTIST